jgi:hypothetical protein
MTQAERQRWRRLTKLVGYATLDKAINALSPNQFVYEWEDGEMTGEKWSK